MIKLNLACGDDYMEGYVNVDLYHDGKVDVKFDVTKLPYPDNSVHEIKAFHIIEHFDWYKGNKILQEWNRVLVPGGKLWMETPDFYAACKDFVMAFETNNINYQTLLCGHFFSTPWMPGQQHLFLFTEPQLKIQLEWAGFTNTKRIAPSSNYLKDYPNHNIFLCVETFKKL